ncbi:transcriptional regulator, LysR family [Paraglaciecola sp. T6c]|uniref:LysR family transcriptional regulator n=1 Tax=Pseudoalteromonas atlantica (strain T6c / ATCC BAA-1087) TaxID=3042615 RepID=UPI00005C752F|nr:LysR family transcriptional regulator [Paraglaciecola sp. T6c]ABG40195.1 transcriptional regulator, LysR family [Paraglaciecola sp. T6c]
MDQLRAIRYFCKVVETGSFTNAATTFNVPPSSLSRRVADLERSLGATLLKRSTRVVRLTEIGRTYYNQVNDILRQLELSNDTVRSYQTVPTGQLRISAMVEFGEPILFPLLEEFSQRYPQIILDVRLSDELSALSRDEVDIAIRGGYAPNERVIAIKLMENQFIAVATKAYLERYGTPNTPLDLSHHKGLYYRTPNGPLRWISEINGQWQDVSAPQVAVSNNGKWLLGKVLAGQGMMMAPKWLLKEYLVSGDLQELSLSPEINITSSSDFGIYLLYQKQRYLVPKVKAAVDFLVARIKQLHA